MTQLEKFIEKNEQGTVKITDGVSYSMKEVNDESFRLYNGKFQDGAIEDNGFERVFMRKMWVVYRAIIQGADLDLKDLKIRSLNGKALGLVGLLRLAFHTHLDLHYFGETIDKIMEQVVWFGSCLVKRTDKGVEVVDLRNYITDPNQPDPEKRSHAETITYKWEDMLKKKDDWSENWAEIEELKEKMDKEDESNFRIIEFWTFEDDKRVCKKYLDNTILSEGKDWIPYIELEKFETPFSYKTLEGEKVKKFPYTQFDFFKVPGRTQGMGVGELLAAPQWVYNELYNNKRKLDIKALMGINVHYAAAGVAGLTELSQEVIANLDTGTVIPLNPGEDFKQLPVDMKTGDWEVMEDKIFELMRQIMGITAWGSGENSVRTTATQATIESKVASTVFDYVKDRMQFGIKRLFNEGYANEIISGITKQEIISIVGSPTELQELDNVLVDNLMNSWAENIKEETGLYPDEAEYAQTKEKIKQDLVSQGDTRFAEIKKELINELKFIIDFEVNDESFDYTERLAALKEMAKDPNSTKSRSKIEDEILSLEGLNPRAYDKTKEELAQIAQEQQIAQANQAQAVAPPAPIQ